MNPRVSDLAHSPHLGNFLGGGEGPRPLQPPLRTPLVRAAALIHQAGALDGQRPQESLYLPIDGPGEPPDQVVVKFR